MAKVVFLQDLLYEHLGTMYISSVLKKNSHRCDIFIDGADRNIINKCIKAKPDIVAFSITTGNQKWVLKTAKLIKNKLKDSIIIVGGPHPTYFPEIINSGYIDIVCRGEGEYAFLELANKLDQKEDITKIKNLWVKKGKKIYRNGFRRLIENLDELPFPDRELYYKYKKLRINPQKRFMTSRGCPYNCSFCFNHVLRTLYKDNGRYVRKRSVENVIREIEYVKNKYGIKTVYFDDDTFILDRKWVMEFLKIYKQRVNLPFICLVRIDLVTEDLIKAFKESKCKSVFFGIETGNEKLRNKLLNKNLSNKAIIRTAKLLKKYKIKFKTYNMLGLPDETLEDAMMTVKLNARIKTDYPWCSIFQPYPGTKLGDYTIEKGYLKEEFNYNDIVPYYSKSLLVNKKNINEIINLQRLFFYGVKFPFLIPLIRKLIMLPPNFIFGFLFIMGYAYTYLGSEHISIINSFKIGLESISRLFYNKGD